MRGDGKLEISGSVIKDSVGGGQHSSGLNLEERAAVTVRQTWIGTTGINDWCLASQFDTQICSGIRLSGASQLTLIDAEIRDNSDWGISAHRKQCGFTQDTFVGTVRFEGTNTITGNNSSASATSLGNPGTHDWNQPDVPSGQVCLP